MGEGWLGAFTPEFFSQFWRGKVGRLRLFFGGSALAVLLFVLIHFDIGVHMHETYLYAGSAEGFFDSKESYLAFSPWLRSIGSFGSYHPNHPLLIWLGELLKGGLAALGVHINVLQAVTAISLAGGIGGAMAFYRLLFLVSADRLFAAIMALVLLFSDIYWFGSKSGEGYVAGQAFNILASHYFLKSLVEPRRSTLLRYAICFGISFAFHSVYFLMIIPQFFMLARQRILRGRLPSPLDAAGVAFVVFFFGAVFYLLPLHLKMGARSFSEMCKMFLFYSEEMGVWTKNYANWAEYLWGAVLRPFVLGYYHLSWGFVTGVGLFPGLLRGLFLVLVALSLFGYLKSANRERAYVALWALTFFVLISHIISVPYDLTYWTFSMPPVVFVLSYGLNRLRQRRWLALLLLISVFGSNFINDIYPKHRVDRSEYFFTNRILQEARGAEKYLLLIADSFAETSYLNYFGLVWEIRTDPRFRDKKIEIVIDGNELNEKISRLLGEAGPILVLSNQSQRPDPLKSMEGALLSTGYRRRSTVELRHYYDPKLDTTSEFEHPNHWYDNGPIGSFWSYQLSLYDKG